MLASSSVLLVLEVVMFSFFSRRRGSGCLGGPKASTDVVNPSEAETRENPKIPKFADLPGMKDSYQSKQISLQAAKSNDWDEMSSISGSNESVRDSVSEAPPSEVDIDGEAVTEIARMLSKSPYFSFEAPSPYGVEDAFHGMSPDAVPSDDDTLLNEPVCIDTGLNLS